MKRIKEFTEFEIVKVESEEKPEYNEENVPYFCSHSEKYNGYCGYGRVIKYADGFMLVDIGTEKSRDCDCTSVQNNHSLAELVNMWNIKRLKGKITLYEGETNE